MYMRSFVLVLSIIIACVGIYWYNKIAMDPEQSNNFVTVIPDFLTPEECRSLASAGVNRGMTPSEVGNDTADDPAKLDEDSRKSEQTWFRDDEHPVARKIREKTRGILESMRPFVNKYSFEDIQVARYKPGGYYKGHFDADDCTSESCPADQRIATMLIYIQSPASGGQTNFPELKLTTPPTLGSAVFFWVANPHTRHTYKQTLHAGMPVKRGEKIIATQWIRAA